MKIHQFVLLAATLVALAACSNRESEERAINEGRAAPAQVATPGQQAEPPFAATCREIEGHWDDQQQQCGMTAAACGNSSGTWQPDTGCVFDLPEAECDATFDMHFEDSKCILRTVSPAFSEVK